MASIGPDAGGVKYQAALDRHLPQERIVQLARECGHRWRERTLGPAMTVHLWIMQVLLSNLSMAGVRHLSRKAVTAAAICQAKMRLPMQLLVRLNQFLLEQITGGKKQPTWHGHRLLGGDGVCYYTPDTARLRKKFGSKKRFGFPLLKAVTLFDLASGAILGQIPLPHRRQESPVLGRLLRWARRGDVVVLDRAYPAFFSLCQARRCGVELVIRLKKNLFAKAGSRRKIKKRLGQEDFLVLWCKPKERPKQISKRQWQMVFGQLTLRQISLNIKRRGWRTRRITVLTTLTDPKAYPAHEITQIYARRWELEINFRHLKQTLNLEHLRSQTVDGVERELMIRSLAYNLVCATMQQAARLWNIEPLRISFADTLHFLLLGAIGIEPARITINPLRPGRFEPRRLKRQKKNYMPFNCSRADARKKAA